MLCLPLKYYVQYIYCSGLVTVFVIESNIYSVTSEDKTLVGPDGKRSSLEIQIDRQNPDSLLSAIPLVNKVTCIDHAAARVAEKLINLTLDHLIDQKDINSEASTTRIENFCSNLKRRDISQMDRVAVVNGKLQVRMNMMRWLKSGDCNTAWLFLVEKFGL